MKKLPQFLIHFFLGALIGLFLLIITTFTSYHLAFQNRIFPKVFINHLNFSNWGKNALQDYFENKNRELAKIKILFLLESQNLHAAFTGQDLNLRYDAAQIAQNASLVGRSGRFFPDLQTKIKIFFEPLYLNAKINFADEKIKESLQGIEKEIYLPPENALFQFEFGKVLTFQKEKTGVGLDLESALEELKTQVKAAEGHQFADFVIILKTKTILPEVTLANANSLGIHTLLGEGVSYFTGSPAARIHNIKQASAKLNGILIKPQAIFSFNQNLGDVSQNTGYQPTWIIKSGRTILGDGGGVCQVSTTVFRAALNTGLPILERQAHAYRVHYYEEKSALGLDATVYEPSPDLKFLNDTPAYLLIQSKVDEENKKLTFQFYGTSDQRTTTLSEPIIWDKSLPPEPLYEDDPSLPLGTIKQVDWAAGGAKAKFDYTVTRNGEIIYQKTFTSLYQPWRAVYLRGTASQ